ncbi:MAG: hypothetical protein AAF745_16120 [Planctomycetota bacterium]
MTLESSNPFLATLTPNSKQFLTFESDPAQFIALIEEYTADLVVFEAYSMAGWVI